MSNVARKFKESASAIFKLTIRQRFRSFVRRVFGLKKKKKPGSSYLFPNALDITKKKKKKKKEHRSTEYFSILLAPIIINDYDKKL